MEYKIFTRGFHFYIVDKTTNREYNALAKDVKISRRKTGHEAFCILGVDDWNQDTIIHIDDISNESDTPYTLASFLEFHENNVGFSSASGSSEAKLKISGYWVDPTGKTDLENWEVGDKFEGWPDATRYVVGKVIALPFDVDDPTKVTLLIDN